MSSVIRPCMFVVAIVSSILGFAHAARAAEVVPPNFVILFADDLGYGDLSCNGHPTIRTPHLDRMAAEGMKFTQFYSAAPVCTPSRAALMTGRLPIRNGMTSSKRFVLFPNSSGGLPDSEITVAQILKGKGYATFCVGKWHLGHLPQYLPTRRGFDHYFGIPYSNDMKNRATGGVPLMRDEEVIENPVEQSTLTPRYTAEAVHFIRENRDKPFFLYLPYTFPHVPLHASDRFLGKSPRGLYGDVVEELDESVGQILDTLRKEGLSERTFAFFTSDNGPWLTQKLHGGSAGLLRDGKGTTWEGGMREPAIAWWPGRIRAASIAVDLAATMDFLPTLARLAGADVPSDRIIDGVDLAPVLFGAGPGLRQTMFYYRGSELMAVRKGAFKAHLITWTNGQKEKELHDPPLLFNLQEDPSEQFDIAARHPDVVADLLKEAEAHRASITPVPDQLAPVIESPPADTK